MLKSDLSPGWRRLVEAMQALNFGRILNLEFIGGEPMPSSLARAFREWKPGAENGPRSELTASDFRLRQEVIEFHQAMSEAGDIILESLEVKHGVPFRWTLEVALIF